MLLMVSDSFLRLNIMLTRTTVPLQNIPPEPFPITAGGTQQLHGLGTGKSSPIIRSRLS